MSIFTPRKKRSLEPEKDPTYCHYCKQSGVREPKAACCPACLPTARAQRAEEKDTIVGQWLRKEIDDEAAVHSLVLMSMIEDQLNGVERDLLNDDALAAYIADAVHAYRTAHPGQQELTVIERCVKDGATAARLYEHFAPGDTRLQEALLSLAGVFGGLDDPELPETRAKVTGVALSLQALLHQFVDTGFKDTFTLPLALTLSTSVVAHVASAALALCGARFDGDQALIVPLASEVDRGALVDQAAAGAADGLTVMANTLRLLLPPEDATAMERVLTPGIADEDIALQRFRGLQQLMQEGDDDA